MNFVAPLFLAGLVALGLPWLLHRFSHQNPDQQPFPSTRFLEAVPPPVTQRRTLRYKTLLALRWLLLGILCLVFARPWFNNDALVGNARSLHAVVIDRSMSMQTGDSFETATDMARDIITALPADDPVRVFAADDRFVELTDGESTVADARVALSEVDAGSARLDVGVLMRRIDALATESVLPVQAHLVSDAQASALPVRRNELFAPSLHALDLTIVDHESPENARLTATASSVDNALMRVVVSMQAFGPGGPVSREFVVRHDGDELIRESVSLAPGETVERIYDDLPLPAVQSPVLDVGFVESDSLSLDDSVSAGVRLDATRRVVVAGFNMRIPDTPGVFIRAALQSGAQARVESVASGANALPDDARHAVIFADPADEAALASALRQTDRGVNVVLIPVPQTGTEEHSGTVRVGRIDSVHPLALEEIAWVSVRQYAHAGFAQRDGDIELLTTSAGEPVLLERPVNSGRLLLLNDPLDGQYSNLPYEPAFVDLISRTVAWFDATGAVPDQVRVGDLFALPARAQLFDSSGTAISGLGDAEESVTMELREPGMYRVLDSRGERYLQVVTDARESDLQPMSEPDVSSWLAQHQVDTRVDRDPLDTDADDVGGAVNAAADRVATQRARSIDRPYWHWLLFAVAAIALIESLFANRRLAVRRDGT